MKLNTRSNLTDQERLEVASVLHALLLDAASHVTGWNTRDAVFHGGTSLRFAWESDRLSEDLDFMVSEHSAEEVLTSAAAVVNRIRQRILAIYPGSSIAFTVKLPKPDSEDKIYVWDVRWSHPKKIGVAKVKVEFFAVPADLLADYKATMLLPSGKKNFAVAVTTHIPVAEVTSLWGDKVKAIATRGGFKFRDAYDLGYIVDYLKNNRLEPSDEERTETLLRVTAIYSKTPEDIIEGLNRRLNDGSFDNYAAFEDDIKKWLPAEKFAVMEKQGILKSYFETAKLEAERGRDLLVAHLEAAPGMKL